MHEFLEAKN